MKKTILFLLGLVLGDLSEAVYGQGTAFIYQGKLNDASTPAQGSYDFRFTLFDAVGPGSGTVVGGSRTNSAVAVSNGLFAVTLDFGAVFGGAARWLEIGVRPAGAGGEFTALSPRQPLLPTPYAMYATTAGTVPNGAITAAKLASGVASANLAAGGLSAVGGGGVVLSEQFNATELLSAGYTKIGRASLIDEAWQERAPGPIGLPPQLARRGHSSVWTGTEMIVWGGLDEAGVPLNTGARYRPSAGTWTLVNTTNAPTPRTGHRAVWTGAEMIVWGGLAAGFFGSTVTNTGARYNPVTDTWTVIGAGGGARQDHSAFWTGTEMIVWGGTVLSSGVFGSSLQPRNDGARYNPSANMWTFLPTAGGPGPRFENSAVFTGTELIIWGGRDSIGSFITTQTNFNDGYRYSLAANNWTPVSLAGAPFRRFGHSAAWTGTEMLVWGGRYAEGSLDVVRSNYNNGARYNPAANTWTPIATAGAPVARGGHDAIWAGNRLVIWGGTDGTNLFETGARYFPAINTWSNLTSLGRPAGRSGHTVVWTESEMIVWGGFNQFLRDLGGRYDPVADTWITTSPTGERSERRGHTAVWTGREVLVWGGFDGERFLNTGGRFFPASNLWVAIPTNGAPSGRSTHTAVWTGTEMIVWGGVGPNFLQTGARFNPVTGVWTPVTTNGAPTPRNGHAAVWSGSQMVVWGGLDGAFVNTGARYNPATDAWTAITATGAPAGRSGAAAAWTGTEMLVWGGVGGTIAAQFPLSSGARYNPNNNSWANLPTANAPAARTAHRSVWTGDDLLVWGGTDLATNLNSGGRYQRAANVWSPLTTNNAPSPRAEHTAIWDGTRMIVWGGADAAGFLNSGGLYDPLTDVWTSTQQGTNASPARAQHAAVWTGSEMVVHGGYRADSQVGTVSFLDDTWQYAPPRTMFLYLKP